MYGLVKRNINTVTPLFDYTESTYEVKKLECNFTGGTEECASGRFQYLLRQT